MHRIDTAGNLAGRFTRGNPQAGQRPTVVGEDWPNAVQEAIAVAIEASGIALAKGNDAQLLAAINVLIGRAYAQSPTPAWFRLFDKIIVQFGLIRGAFGEGALPIALPTTFPNNFTGIALTPHNQGGAATSCRVQHGSRSLSGFAANIVFEPGATSCTGFDFIAIGN